MKIIDSIAALNEALAIVRKAGRTIGFVPTMGALHEGHMALIAAAKRKADFVVCSVFVNPTQFTNASDLDLYPRTPEKDTALLEENGCDIAFFPQVAEMYPAGYRSSEVPLGKLESVMEGEFRPGHFKGVVEIVHRFFELVKPDFAFFGMKDFQQVAVIRHMVDYLGLPVQVVPCPTLREASGLAMSSRNIRLSEEDKQESLVIYRALREAKELSASHSPAEVTAAITHSFASSSLQLEYFTIVHPQTLEVLTTAWAPGATACLAAYCREVRLIDNMLLKEE